MSKTSIFKRILQAVIGCFLFILIAFGWMKYNEGGPAPYPINTGSFYTIGSATIDPMTLLSDAKTGKEPFLINIQSDFPEDTTFIAVVGWSQNDYLEIARALFRVIWNDDPRNWYLYRIKFSTRCENPSGKFEYADFYYFQEVRRDGKVLYAVRNIFIEPEYGYIAWGGDSFYPRPMLDRWDKIDLESIDALPAEQALIIADQQEGNEFRKKTANACRISMSIWPWGVNGNNWSVWYSGKVDPTNLEVLIPLKQD
jgi:hypothetical protein